MFTGSTNRLFLVRDPHNFYNNVYPPGSLTAILPLKISKKNKNVKFHPPPAKKTVLFLHGHAMTRPSYLSTKKNIQETSETPITRSP